VQGASPAALLPGAGSGWAQRGVIATGQGAALGVPRGFLSADPDPEASWAESLNQRAEGGTEQGALEAFLSGVTQGGIELVGPALRAAGRGAGVGGWARDLATTERIRSSGMNPDPLPRGPLGRQVQRMGGRERLAEMLREQRVGGALPTPPSSVRDIARVGEEAFEAMDDVTRRMDASGQAVDMSAFLRTMEEEADALAASRIPAFQDAARRMRRELVEPFAEFGPRFEGPAQPMSFREAHQLRQQFDELATTFAADPPLRSLSGRATMARREVSALMNDAAEAVDPAIREQWRTGNRSAQLYYTMRDHARETASNLPGAIAEGAAIFEALRTGSPAALAASMTARGVGRVTGRVWPGIRARSAEGIASRMRAAGQSGWAGMLEAAEPRGAIAVAAVHNVLMTARPLYRAMVNAFADEDRESPEGEEETE